MKPTYINENLSGMTIRMRGVRTCLRAWGGHESVPGAGEWTRGGSAGPVRTVHPTPQPQRLEAGQLTVLTCSRGLASLVLSIYFFTL